MGVELDVDAEERQALVDDGLDPDDPGVVAIDLVRWELSLLSESYRDLSGPSQRQSGDGERFRFERG